MAQNYTTRKRGRNNCEEECCGFMPLSKRINNLHIDGNLYNCDQRSEQNFFKKEEELDEWDSLHHEKLSQAQYVSSNSSSENNTNATFSGNFIENNCTTPSPTNNEHPWMTETIINQYSPSLTATDNPYYYENNKLLFALYMERLQRGGVPLY